MISVYLTTAQLQIDARSLSRQDIQILVGHGCPSSDKKVTLSAKLLRKHVHLDEGDVRLLSLIKHSLFQFQSRGQVLMS